MRKRWLFIDSGPCTPSFNMAMDEALLNWHSEGKIPPVIRFYEWEPASLSIGYFQKAEKEIDLQAVNEKGIGFVRRPTGGRAVLHEHELTYSVIVNEDDPDMPKNVTEAYRVISEGILQGFLKLGLDAYFAVPSTEEEREALKAPKSAVCFDASSWYELVVEGRKIAGSAQTRQKGVILQHGSILFELNSERLFSLFKFSNESIRSRMKEKFLTRAASIQDLAGRSISITEASEAFRKGFEEGLNVELVPYELSREQLQEVKELARSKYESDEWSFMR